MASMVASNVLMPVVAPSASPFGKGSEEANVEAVESEEAAAIGAGQDLLRPVDCCFFGAPSLRLLLQIERGLGERCRRAIFVICQVQASVRRWKAMQASGFCTLHSASCEVQRCVRQRFASSIVCTPAGFENAANAETKSQRISEESATSNRSRQPKKPPTSHAPEPNLYCLRRWSMEEGAASASASASNAPEDPVGGAILNLIQTPLKRNPHLRAEITQQAKTNQLTRKNTALNEGYKHCVLHYKDRYARETPLSASPLRLAARLAMRSKGDASVGAAAQLPKNGCDGGEACFGVVGAASEVVRVSWDPTLAYFDCDRDRSRSRSRNLCDSAMGCTRPSILKRSGNEPLSFAKLPPHPTIVEVQNLAAEEEEEEESSEHRLATATRTGSTTSRKSKKPFSQPSSSSSCSSNRPKKKRL